jgi:hypothetical protein
VDVATQSTLGTRIPFLTASIGDAWDWLDGWMDWGTLVAGVIGAGVTAFLGWWISGQLAVQAEFRNLRASMWIVHTELEENCRRFTQAKERGADIETLRGCLLLGDWMSTKLHLAGLSLQGPENENLVRMVAGLYGDISEYQSGRSTREPNPNAMADLATRLGQVRAGIKQKTLTRQITYKKPAGSSSA